MYGKPATIFYSLASFVLFTALFAMQNSAVPEVAALQEQIQHEFSVAVVQTIGDGPILKEVALIFDSVSEFYRQSSEAALAMVQDEATDRDLAFIYTQAYNQVLLSFHPSPAAPVTAAVIEPVGGAVSGLSTEAVNAQMPWVTMRDNLTGQLYCVALYNGELNKYLGACQYDYH